MNLNQTKTAPGKGLSGCAVSDCPPDSPGISSALKELLSEIEENANLASNLESSLGISFPEPSQEKPPNNSLYDSLRVAASSVRRSNGRMTETLRHING